MSIDLTVIPAPGAAASAFLKKAKKVLINGQWLDASSREYFETLDPATGTCLAKVPLCGREEVDAAVAAARQSLDAGVWSKMTPSERGKILWKVAELIEQNIDELAELETLDQGKPLYVGRWAEIPGAAEQFRFFAGEASKIEGSAIPSSISYQPEGKRIHAYTRKEPVGVVAAILPWNSPLVLTAMKLAPALAAGCSIVLKPAEDTSLTSIRLCELLVEAGVPSGVINLVTGYGASTGKLLAEHQDVDKIGFTGSTETGRAILDAAKGNLKKVTLELGGKSPVIILEDADLSAAIPGAANAIFFNGGQVCVAGSRLYVHRNIYDAVVKGIVEQAKAIKLGHGLDPDTQMGPLVSRVQADRVLGFIERAREAGATIETGGNRVQGTDCFVEPTVITNVTPGMEIVREEIFGPVIVCTPFDSVAEVLELSNDSCYGLAAGIWTESLSSAHTLAEDLKAGTVWVNCHSMYDASLPIGGMRQSGWGRDSGRGAVENYLETKTVCAVV